MKCLLLVLFSLVTLVVSQEAEDEKAAPQQQQQLLQPEPTRPQTQVVFDDTILFNISFANLEKNQTQNIDNQVRWGTLRMLQIIYILFPTETLRESCHSQFQSRSLRMYSSGHSVTGR